MTLAGDRRYTVELHASAERVPQIRRIVAAHLRYWRLDPHVPSVCRAVTELLTNVHRHLGPDARCVVEIRCSGRHLTAAVADEGPPLPRLESGGGLSTVAALSDSWGTCGTEDGKVVWFTQRVDRAVETPLAAPTPLRSVPDAKGQPAASPAQPREPRPEETLAGNPATAPLAEAV
ncbi:ATP-binding protein [Streptomyces sp. Pv4-95]|uniref:ATP-binding protein n=1 Tax=Streptomyces sp. Pv4-95 TaxID=3049543 RepID=UPI003892BEFA